MLGILVLEKAMSVTTSAEYTPGIINIDFLHELSHLSVLEEGPLSAIQYLNQYGIKVIVERHLPRIYLDGAAIMLVKSNPVVGLTIRYDRTDNFWFTLFHELSHISLHFDMESDTFYDDLDIEAEEDPREREANELAGEALIPHDAWENSPASRLKSPQAAEHLAKQLNAFLDSITDTIDTEVEASIEEVISKGESISLEFKASFRWDYSKGSVNSKLEQAVIKTIAAFSNAEGGTLLIGVNDEGEVLGLDNDYTSLKGNRDEFELHFRNLINQNFGKIFASSNVDIIFPISDEYELCQIEVKRGINPIYITISDKNGVRAEKFYIRSGNSSQELSISEIASYVNSRFHGI